MGIAINKNNRRYNLTEHGGNVSAVIDKVGFISR